MSAPTDTMKETSVNILPFPGRSRMSDELIEAVNAAYSGGEFQHAKDAARLIPDELVRKIAFCGTPAQAQEKLDWLREAGVGAVSVFPLGQDRRGTIARFAELALERA